MSKRNSRRRSSAKAAAAEGIPKEEAKPNEEVPNLEATPTEEAVKEEGKPTKESEKEEAEAQPSEEARPPAAVDSNPAEEVTPAEEEPKEEAKAAEEMPMEEAKPVEEVLKEEVTRAEEAVKEESRPAEEAQKEAANAQPAEEEVKAEPGKEDLPAAKEEAHPAEEPHRASLLGSFKHGLAHMMHLDGEQQDSKPAIDEAEVAPPAHEARPAQEASREEAKAAEEAPTEEAKPAEEAPREEAKAAEEIPTEEAKPLEEVPKEEVTPTKQAVQEDSKPAEEASKEEANAQATEKSRPPVPSEADDASVTVEPRRESNALVVEEASPMEGQATELADAKADDLTPAHTAAAKKVPAISSMPSRPALRSQGTKIKKGAPKRNAKPAAEEAPQEESAPTEEATGEEAEADADIAPDDSALSSLSLSPRSAMRSPRTRIKKGCPIQAHLFGEVLGPVSSPRAKLPPPKKYITKEDLERIAKPRGPPKEFETDVNCTFKPAIDENSRKMLQASSAGDGSEPRFHTLALSKTPEAKQRLQTAKQRQDEAEMAPCTFKPSTNWHDPKRRKKEEWSKSTSRYTEHIPQRYVKAKEDLANKKKEEEAEANRPREPAKKPTKKLAQSPRSDVTTPVPFQSRTALRKQQREQSQTELVVDLDDPVFAELHGMLHSLQLNGQRFH